MSFATKRTVVFTMVVFLGLWPACHYFVIRALDLNPWNWYGWAMYTQPAERVVARGSSLDGEPMNPSRLSESEQRFLQNTYTIWSLRYLEVKEFDKPDEFARAILRVYDGWDGVLIEVTIYGLDRETALYDERSRAEYRYTRAEVGLD